MFRGDVAKGETGRRVKGQGLQLAYDALLGGSKRRKASVPMMPAQTTYCPTLARCWQRTTERFSSARHAAVVKEAGR